MSAVAGIAMPGARRGWVGWVEARRWAVLALYLALTGIALYPVLSVAVPPLVDYPNHLARMHVLANWASDPALQQNYVVNWRLLPNMAEDLIVPLLARFMPLYAAGKVFVVLTLLSLLGGTIALRKVVVGRVGFWPVLTFLVLYNEALFWGFLNYLFTAGLAMAAFAGWIAMRARPAFLRIAVFATVAVALYVGHLFGLLIYALLVAGYELWRLRARPAPVRRQLGDWAVAGAQFLVPAAHFLIWVARNASTDGARTAFGTIADRFDVFAAPVNVGLQAVDEAALLFLIGVWLLFLLSAGVRLAPPLRLPVLIVAVVTLAMPVYLSGVWGTHVRLPVVLACLLIAGAEVTRPAWRAEPFVAAAALFLIVIRTGAIAGEWRGVDRDIAELRQAMAAMAPGARLLPVRDDADIQAQRSPFYARQFWHMASLAVIERSVFLPTEFTGHTMVDAAPALRRIDTPAGDPITPDMLIEDADAATSRFPLGHSLERYMRTFWVGWPQNFDYVLEFRFDKLRNPDPRHLVPLRRGSYFDIYRVSPGREARVK
jgi:hypothetical protein